MFYCEVICCFELNNSGFLGLWVNYNKVNESYDISIIHFFLVDYYLILKSLGKSI